MIEGAKNLRKRSPSMKFTSPSPTTISGKRPRLIKLIWTFLSFFHSLGLSSFISPETLRNSPGDSELLRASALGRKAILTSTVKRQLALRKEAFQKRY